MNNYYYTIIDNLFNTISDNSNILLIFQNEFNILDNFSHIIKKKNITISIIITDISIYEKLLVNIKGEECESQINIFKDICDIRDIFIFDIINIFHLISLEYLNDTINILKKNINENTLIYIYCSLSNENIEKIDYKNYIRNKITYYTKNKFGILLSLSDVIRCIEKNEYKINSLRIYKSNNYIIYGDNNVYEINLRLYF
jgi:hypothetical protein